MQHTVTLISSLSDVYHKTEINLLFTCNLHDGNIFEMIVFWRPFVHGANRCSKVIATGYVQLIISCNSRHCTLQGQLSLLSLRATSAVPFSATAIFWLIWNNAAWWPIVRKYTKSHNRHENSANVNQYPHHRQCVVVNLWMISRDRETCLTFTNVKTGVC